jgi:hypothetical protein
MTKWLLLLASVSATALAELPAKAQQQSPAPASERKTRGVRVLKAEPAKEAETVAPDAAPDTAPDATPDATSDAQPAEAEVKVEEAKVEEVNAAEAAPPAPPSRVCDRAFPAADLALSDTRGFDQGLLALLSKKPDRVVIDVPERFDPSSPPQRLQSWLAQVAEGGGSVTAREISCTRGFGLGKALAKLFGRREPIHNAIRGYDATLWYEKSSSKVTQIQLVKLQ